MKTLFMLLISAPLFACPELKGTYTTCVSNSGIEYHWSLKIEQAPEGPTYKMTQIYPETGLTSRSEFIVDGKPHATTYYDEAAGRNMATIQTAICEDDTLKTSIEISSGPNHKLITNARWRMLEDKLVIEELDDWQDEGKNNFTLTCE
ncbi:MAG: hypothetical protein AB7I27_09435 [Bacteriovoracaceae bacterium]